MRKFIPIFFLLLSCGTEPETSKIPIEKKLQIRELNLQSEADGSVPIPDLLPACDRNCKLWHVEKPEDIFFCLKYGEEWRVLSEYVGPDETMYCNL